MIPNFLLASKEPGWLLFPKRRELVVRGAGLKHQLTVWLKQGRRSGRAPKPRKADGDDFSILRLMIPEPRNAPDSGGSPGRPGNYSIQSLTVL